MRKRLHQRVIAAVMSAAAAIIIGVLLLPSANTRQPAQSDSAAHVIAALARAGIPGECTMTETRRENSDGSTVFTCRVVVYVNDSNYPYDVLYGQKLLSVTATYDSIVSGGMSYTTLQTELNFTGGLQTVSNDLR